MSNIEFGEEQYSQTTNAGHKPSKMATALIALGVVKDEKGANFLLLGVIIILVIIVCISLLDGTQTNFPTQEEKRASQRGAE